MKITSMPSNLVADFNQPMFVQLRTDRCYRKNNCSRVYAIAFIRMRRPDGTEFDNNIIIGIYEENGDYLLETLEKHAITSVRADFKEVKKPKDFDMSKALETLKEASISGNFNFFNEFPGTI